MGLVGEVAETKPFLASGQESMEASLDADVQLSNATSYRAMRAVRHIN